MRQAVERKYLATDEDKLKGHLALADFFTGQDIDNRYVSNFVQTIPSRLHKRIEKLDF